MSLREECKVKTDALGNDIIIGAKYGYSSTKDGWSSTVIGIATRFTPSGKVTLENISRKRYLYARSSELWGNEKDKVNINPHILFPVNN